MRICIFGAGAAGSHFAERLALAGHDVSCVMRGPHLEAVKKNGLTLRVGDAEFKGKLRAAVPKERIIGGVIFSSNEVVAPGLVTNLSPDRNRLLIGECDDRKSERIAQLRAALNEASIESADVAEIRET